MEAEWIRKSKEKYQQLFEKLKGNIPKEGMYFVPRQYQDAKDLYSKKAQKSSFIKSQIQYENKVYKQIQNCIPMQIGKTLELLFESPTHDVLIHRTDQSLEQITQFMFQRGIPVRSTDYTTHLSKYKHFPTLLMNIMACKEFRNSQGCLLIRIPKNNKLPLYYEDDQFLPDSKQLFLLPEYIYGYVPVKDEILEDVIINPNYIENHHYAVDELYYDETLNPLEYQQQMEEQYKSK